ncbi:MAG: efflux RND transporter periplasmic adaptor subunit [Nitrospira sp.]|nr:efflux RND transporter periplasmic adaptor subunit [Nitrospira sp.]
MNRQSRLGSVLLVLFVLLIGLGLAAWKYESVQVEQAASSHQPEPMESVTVAVARAIDHRQTTTSIGTVLALRSITLKNELAGTVRDVHLTPGQIVEAGTLLVALDVSVEEADLQAQEAQVTLAKTVLNRRQRLNQELATTQEEVDRARADLDVARAQIVRTKALIAKKTIRAPFRVRIGIADVHPGQYLDEGTLLTTLQGIGDAVHVDFSVAQQIAAGLRVGEIVEVFAAGDSPVVPAKIIALDSRVDPTTRNAMVRARIEETQYIPAPDPTPRSISASVLTSERSRRSPIGSCVRCSPSSRHYPVCNESRSRVSDRSRCASGSTLTGSRPSISHQATCRVRFDETIIWLRLDARKAIWFRSTFWRTRIFARPVSLKS